MKQLLFPSEAFTNRVEDFGFEYLSFETRKLQPGETHNGETNDRELAIVVLGGVCSVFSSRGEWHNFGRRATVFDGLPFTLYLPVRTSFSITTDKGCDLALCYAKAEEEYLPRLITPDKVGIEIRGGGNATRQINSMVPPTFLAHRLMVVEVFTPAGNWSSFPPHKHDVHNPPSEVDLDEIYYYRMRQPEGFAFQHLYSGNHDGEQTLKPRDGDTVLVRSGYHPVVAGPGYDVYYLNFLAGSSRALAVTEDPNHVWIRSTWKETDPRLPLVR